MKIYLRFTIQRLRKRPNPGDVRGQIDGIRPFLAASVPGRQIAHTKSPVAGFSCPGTSAIKSIVLMDFTDIVRIAPSVPFLPPHTLLLSIVF
jgi:hypothetical protein